MKKLKYEFKGPSKFIQKTHEFKKIKTQDIIHAYIKIGKKIREVRDNNITYILEKNNIYMYHIFNDIDYSGRWYNVNFPKEDIINIKNNKLEIKINPWEDMGTNKLTKATVIIEFSDNAIKKMLNMLL